jgi:pimeloyl-ACP methyl ester carboxylesterase
MKEGIMDSDHRFNLLNYVVEGEGPPVVLVHGISASINHWKFLMPELVSAGYTAIAMDLFGHGDSVKPRNPNLYTTAAVYGTFEALLENLPIDPPYYLVGHSIGGYVSLRYARSNPKKVRAMVLINPLFSLKQLSPFLSITMPMDFMGVMMIRLVPQWVVNTFLSMNEEFTTDLSPEVRRMYAGDVKRASPEFLRIPNSANDLTPLLKQIPTKTLVIYGVNDHIENPALFPKLINGLPNATGRPVEGCGHQPHHHKPELVDPMILDFIKKN